VSAGVVTCEQTYKRLDFTLVEALIKNVRQYCNAHDEYRRDHSGFKLQLNVDLRRVRSPVRSGRCGCRVVWRYVAV
jgi:hypothetical protein